MINHPEGESCSDLGRVLVLNDPSLWSFVSLAATRGVALPTCYPALWRAARGLDPHSFLDVNWCNMFHAYLIHTELVSAGVWPGRCRPPRHRMPFNPGYEDSTFVSLTWRECQADIARHVVGCHSTQETRVKISRR